MHEVVVNLHMHTRYSDGYGSHLDIAQAALRAGLDAVIVTDHNVWVNGPEDIYQEGQRRVLLLVGEEVHDQARLPQKSHLLVIGAGREVATLAHDPQLLVNEVRRSGGLSFIAHPKDPEAPAVGALVKEIIGKHGLKMPRLAMPLRVMLTGQTQTPSVDAVVTLFPREMVLMRMERQLEKFLA